MAITDYYQLPKNAIFSKSRKKEIAHARGVYYYLAQEFSGETHEVASRYIGRHHATSLHFCNKIAFEKNIYSVLNIDLNKITSKIVESNYCIFADESINLLKICKKNTKDFYKKNDKNLIVYMSEDAIEIDWTKK